MGTTNRTHITDYARALDRIPEGTRACVLKVHPSNYRISGFTAGASVAELSELSKHHGLPLVADIGSGLLSHEPALPEEPDLSTTLSDGADLVIASGDKLLGGPQAYLLLGSSAVISQLSAHPMARAMRTDKLTLAAMEATLNGGRTPVSDALQTDPEELRRRTEGMAESLDARTVPHDGRVGGGGAPEFPLPGWAVQLPQAAASLLRRHEPPVLARTHDKTCLIDLRCVPRATIPPSWKQPAGHWRSSPQHAGVMPEHVRHGDRRARRPREVDLGARPHRNRA